MKNINNTDETSIKTIEQTLVTTKYINLYYLYYVLESKRLINELSSEERKITIQELENFNIIEFIQNYSGSLYDLWLFIKTSELLGIEINETKEICKYLDSLKTQEGFYLSYSGENIQNSLSSYLLSTKMVLEISERVGYENIDYKRIYNWLINYEETLLKLENDPISYASQLYLIKYIQENLKNNDNNYQLKFGNIGFYYNRAKELLLESEDNILKFEVILQLNSLFEDNQIPIEFEEITFYLSSIRLPSGGYPLYGIQNQPADILTT